MTIGDVVKFRVLCKLITVFNPKERKHVNVSRFLLKIAGYTVPEA